MNPYLPDGQRRRTVQTGGTSVERQPHAGYPARRSSQDKSERPKRPFPLSCPQSPPSAGAGREARARSLFALDNQNDFQYTTMSEQMLRCTAMPSEMCNHVC